MGRSRVIVVDSSALVAILEDEPDAERFLKALQDAPRRLASAVTIYETGIVILRKRGRGRLASFADFIEAVSIEPVPFTEPYVSRALEAYARFGKGVDPKARLNLGDCASYALAQSFDAPLLFKGADFGATDVRQYV